MTESSTSNINEAKLLAELVCVQKRCRTRLMDVSEVIEAARDIASALESAPPRTMIRGPLHDRVSNSYPGIPEGTTVQGDKAASGEIEVHVLRDRRAFGNRRYIVTPPGGVRVRGEGVHTSTGSAHHIAALTFEGKPTE